MSSDSDAPRVRYELKKGHDEPIKDAFDRLNWAATEGRFHDVLDDVVPVLEVQSGWIRDQHPTYQTQWEKLNEKTYEDLGSEEAHFQRLLDKLELMYTWFVQAEIIAERRHGFGDLELMKDLEEHEGDEAWRSRHVRDADAED